MAFEGLSEKLNATFKRLRGKGRLTEADVREGMREVRLALLEADVSYKVVKDFVASVTEKCEGADVQDSLTTATTELEATKATLAATEAELTTTQETLADAQAILAASNESLSFAKLNPATRGTDPGIAPSPMASAVRDPSEAVAFLLVTVGTKTYEPIPLLEDGYYRLIHGVCVNIIHVSETSIEMTDASCADHDCIAQGIVTLENKDTREGGSYIICQQNFVTLRLCTRAELEAEGIVLQ